MRNGKQKARSLFSLSKSMKTIAYGSIKKAVDRLAKMLKTEIKKELFVADCTKQLPYIIPEYYFNRCAIWTVGRFGKAKRRRTFH